MSVVLALVGLPLALVLPGLSTVAALAPLRRLDWLERAYLVLAISLVLSGWTTVLLGWIGIFSAWLLVGLLAIYSLALGIVAWRRGGWHWPRPERRESPLWLLAFLALSALLGILLFRPFELILGPRDAAVYPATAEQIATHGSIVIHDPLLSELAQTPTENRDRLLAQFFLPQHPGRFYYTSARMPGFFVADLDQGTVVPQFYPLYPSWLAVAFSLVGIKAGLLMTPYLAFLGGIGVLLVARRLFGSPIALLAYLFLGLNTLQVWFARYSTSEGATQFLTFLAAFGLICLEDEDSPFSGLLAGVALGMVGLVRVDFFFTWALLLPYFAYLFVTRRFRRSHWFLLLALGLLAVQTLALFLTLTRNYTLNMYYHRIQDWYALSWLVYPLLSPTLQEYFFNSDTPRTAVMYQPWRLIYELGGPLLVAGLLVGLRRSPGLLARIGAWLRRYSRLLLGIAAGLVILATAYAYLVRPGILTLDMLLHPLQNRLVLEGYIGAPVPVGAEGNLVRLGWYFSPLGMVLGGIGVVGLLLREANRRTWFLLLIGLFYGAFFTYELFGESHHVYIMRRYIPEVIPFLCIAMAYALGWLGSWCKFRVSEDPAAPLRPAQDNRRSWPRRLRPAGRVAAVAVTVLLAVYLAYTGLPFFQHQEYRGALDQVSALAGRFQPDDIILLIDDNRDAPFTIATPLQYLFDRQALVLVGMPPSAPTIEKQIQRWQEQGRNVYLLSGNDGGRMFLPHIRLQALGKFELAVPEFEQLTKQKPHNAYILRQPFGIYALEPWSGPGSPLGSLPIQVDLGSADYPYQVAGFYVDEAAPDGSTYCWTNGEGVLRLPWPSEGTVTITLRLAGGKRPAELGPAQVEARVGERSLGSWSLQEGFTAHTIVLAAGDLSPDAAGTVLLSLVSPTWRQVDYGLGADRRPLGVEVDWVRVETAGGTDAVSTMP